MLPKIVTLLKTNENLRHTKYGEYFIADFELKDEEMFSPYNIVLYFETTTPCLVEGECLRLNPN